MNNRTIANVVLESKDYETRNQVATLQTKSKNIPLYEDEDNGLLFYENGKKQYFMEMINETDYDEVIKNIDEFMFTQCDTKTVQVIF